MGLSHATLGSPSIDGKDHEDRKTDEHHDYKESDATGYSGEELGADHTYDERAKSNSQDETDENAGSYLAKTRKEKPLHIFAPPANAQYLID